MDFVREAAEFKHNPLRHGSDSQNRSFHADTSGLNPTPGKSCCPVPQRPINVGRQNRGVTDYQNSAYFTGYL